MYKFSCYSNLVRLDLSSFFEAVLWLNFNFWQIFPLTPCWWSACNAQSIFHLQQNTNNIKSNMCSNLTHYVKVEYISMCKTKLHIFNEKQKKIMRVMEILLEKVQYLLIFSLVLLYIHKSIKYKFFKNKLPMNCKVKTRVDSLLHWI